MQLLRETRGFCANVNIKAMSAASLMQPLSEIRLYFIALAMETNKPNFFLIDVDHKLLITTDTLAQQCLCLQP